MKKLILFAALLFLFTNCGSDSSVDAEALCDGDILIPFQEKKGKDWGYINLKGEIIVDPEFDRRPSFAVNGMARISDYSKKDDKMYYRFIKITDGKVKKSKKKWDMAGEFREGLAPVRKENAYVQFIDEDYKVVFTAKTAEEVSYFNDGLAAFKNKKGKWGFLDQTGKVAIKPKYDFVNNGFVEGYAIVGNIIDNERTFKIIGKDGKTVLNCKDKYNDVISISEGMIKVEDDGYGFIDIEGDKIIKVDDEWRLVTDFVNGYASFLEDDEWGLVDKEGEKIFNAKFENAIYVFDDRFWYLEDGEWGVMDLDGKDIIEPEFKSDIQPYPFFCETSIVGEGRNDFIFIDDEGMEFSKNEYDRVAEMDYRHIMNAPWNQTFESDYFDPAALSELISSSIVDKSNGVSLLKMLGIKKEELWNNKDQGFDYIGDLKYRFYAEGSRVHSFEMYEQSGASIPYYEEGPEAVVAPRDDVSAYRRLLEEEGDDYEHPFNWGDDDKEEGVEYDAYMKEYVKEKLGIEEEVKVDSKYPMDAPMGIESVSFQILFDDYMGISDSVEMDDAQAYYMDDEKTTNLYLNTKANVRSISITIEMEGRGYGKANKLAEAIAKTWKTKITSIKSEVNKNGAYRISGKTSKGDIIIRSSGKGTVTIEINFDYTEE